MKKLILLGAPGAGKGTQAELLSEKLDIPIISTGNILKQAVREQTPLGLEAACYINDGKLVPDSVIISIVKERLASSDCNCGFILDGVPRTINQAKTLDDMGVEITDVLSIEVSDEVIMERMTGRRICGLCGSSYHTTAKRPATEGICDRCGGELVTRPDDRPEIVKERLATYHTVTEPLKGYYSAKGLLKEIEGKQDIAGTFDLVMKELGVQ